MLNIIPTFNWINRCLFLDLSPTFIFYLLACVYTEGGVEDVGLAAGLVSVGPKNFV